MRALVRGVSVAMVLLGGGAWAAFTGCSNDEAPCDSAKCAANNECIARGSETKCRLKCDSDNGCPTGYRCEVEQSPSYCHPEADATFPRGFGVRCAPPDGIEGNPACNTDRGLACFARSPTDADAYCTKFDCATDADCPKSFFCATVNEAPNATTPQRSFGGTKRVCQRREFCAPCETDSDCPRTGDGRVQFCATAPTGRFCTTECAEDSNCRLDAQCEAIADGKKACTPRGGGCVGDGTFCSRCRADSDCKGGFCFETRFSPERFCAMPTQRPCADGGVDSCPEVPDGAAPLGVACTIRNTDEVRIDHCVGLVQQGTDRNSGEPNPTIGCWTRAR
jgi:hypothetical protein